MKFDGRGFADKIARDLKLQVSRMARKPKLVAIVDPANEAGVKYCQLKAEMAARLGVEFQVTMTKPQASIKSQISSLKSQIEVWNKDDSVDGIMVQMPMLNADELIKLTALEKDVDGLREDSPLQPAVVRAIVEILNSKFKDPNKSQIQNLKTAVVGAKGFVGSRLMQALAVKDNPFVAGMDEEDFDPERSRRADVIISATGQAGLITGSMVKDGFVAIDVGYPRPEFTPDALAKASFYTPVPGGVGPVTVVMLFKNLVEGVK